MSGASVPHCTSVNWNITYDGCAQPTLSCTARLDDDTVLTSQGLNLSGAPDVCASPNELEDALVHLQHDLQQLFYTGDPEPFIFDTVLAGLNVAKYTWAGLQSASITFYKLCSYLNDLDLYALFAALLEQEFVSLPLPHLKIIGNLPWGGSEYYLLPTTRATYQETLAMAVTLQRSYQTLLQKNNIPFQTHNKGYISFAKTYERKKIALLASALEELAREHNYEFVLGIDPKTSQSFCTHKKIYTVGSSKKSCSEMLTSYQGLMHKYPIVSWIEPFSCLDLPGMEAWYIATQTLCEHEHIQTAYDSDDPLVPAQARRFSPLAYLTTANALHAMQSYHDNGKRTILTFPEECTDATWIANFSVGAGASQLLLDGITSPRNIAVYNCILAIEQGC